MHGVWGRGPRRGAGVEPPRYPSFSFAGNRWRRSNRLEALPFEFALPPDALEHAEGRGVLDPVEHRTTLPLVREHPVRLHQFQVLRAGVRRDAERAGEFAHRLRPPLEKFHDPQAVVVCEHAQAAGGAFEEIIGDGRGAGG